MNRRNVWMLLFLSFLLLPLTAAFAEDDTVILEVNLTYDYDRARAVFPLVNAFRAEDGVWYWNGDNSERVRPAGLLPLVYDYGLEKVAMQRAAECAIRYAHTRPNDTAWSTLAPPGGGYRAENIASGYSSASSVFNAWREENQGYDGQGHRRNMLNTAFKAIGVGCVSAGGRYYWAQAFSSASTGETEVILTSPAMIEAKLSVLSAQGMTNPVPMHSSIQMQVGETADIPGIRYTQRNGSASFRVLMTNPPWTVADERILSLAGGRLTALNAGRTSLQWTQNGKTVETVVTVQCIHDWNIVERVESTPTAHGSMVSVCTLCGQRETTVLHFPIPIEGYDGIAPTYETEGELPLSYCAICSLVLEEKIPALKDLQVLKLPVNLTEIDAEAFEGANCQAVIVPDSCLHIGEGAFRNCGSLIFASVPAGAEVDAAAFEGCDQAWIYRRETEQ